MLVERSHLYRVLSVNLATPAKNLYNREIPESSNRFLMAGLFVRRKPPPNKVTRSARMIAYRLVGLQAMIVFVIALGWWIKGMIEGFSVLLGGTASLLPGLFFAHRLFSTTSPQAVKRIMINFYLGEVIKLAFSAVLVIVIVLYIPVSIILFTMGFMGVQFGFWLAPLVIKSDRV